MACLHPKKKMNMRRKKPFDKYRLAFVAVLLQKGCSQLMMARQRTADRSIDHQGATRRE